MTDTPQTLSIIIASTAGFQETVDTVAAIRTQSHGRPVEVLSVHVSDGDSSEATAKQYSDVINISVPRPAPLPRLLAAALEQATGDVIAITDASCGIDESWVTAILKAHEEPHPVVGGAVEPEGLRSLVDWTAYFCDYGQFMLPLAEGVVKEVPGNNISVKRWALVKGNEFIQGEFWKTYWCQEIQSQGHDLYSVPSVVVSYRKSFRLWEYLVHRFQNGRCFAGMRNAQLGFHQRIIYLAGSLALPVLFCGRILRAILPKRRFLGRLVLSFPVILLATISWSMGEFCGYFKGPGTSCLHVK
jgi:glycosyltransferase involved in cell wall biosynthesis